MAILHWKQGFLCDKKIIKRVLRNVTKRDFGELYNVFQDEFDKIYHNSQRMSYSFYHITESSELN